MRNWVWFKIFLILLLSSIALLNLNIGFETYAATEKGCYAWSAGSSFKCTISFIPAGLEIALSRNFLFSPFFEGQTKELLPQSSFGWVLFVGWICIYLVILWLLYRIGISFWARNHGPRIKKTKSMNLDFALFAISLIAFGAGGILFLKARNQQPTDAQIKAVTFSSSPTVQPTTDIGFVTSLLTKISQESISPDELSQTLAQAISAKKIDARMLSKVFDSALGRCRDDYMQIILKYPLQPHPKDYDKKYMKSLYTRVIEPGCDKFYQQMGWADGCQVDLAGDVCGRLTQLGNQYLNIFKKKESQLTCRNNSDCFVSESMACGKVLVGSRNAFSNNELLNEDQMRCQLNRLKMACTKANPGFLRCEKLENWYAECRNSICIPIRQL